MPRPNSLFDSPPRGWRIVRHGRPSEALEMRTLGDLVPGPREILVRVATSIRTLVSETVPFDKLSQALNRMEERSTVGRIVVQIGKS